MVSGSLLHAVSIRASEYLNFPVTVCFHLLTSEKKGEELEEKCWMLLEHAIRTPIFCLHVRAYAFSYTPATYQLRTRNVGNEKK
jgi:hypothetical protein